LPARAASAAEEDAVVAVVDVVLLPLAMFVAELAEDLEVLKAALVMVELEASAALEEQVASEVPQAMVVVVEVLHTVEVLPAMAEAPLTVEVLLVVGSVVEATATHPAAEDQAVTLGGRFSPHHTRHNRPDLPSQPFLHNAHHMDFVIGVSRASFSFSLFNFRSNSICFCFRESGLCSYPDRHIDSV
jgi:hypothetical protein